jgi:hypothetical protein
MATLRRRTLIGGAAATLSLCALPAAAAPAKSSKKDVAYQDHPMDIRSCATCTSFVAPKSCKVVAGEVSPKGWCTLFAQVD